MWEKKGNMCNCSTYYIVSNVLIRFTFLSARKHAKLATMLPMPKESRGRGGGSGGVYRNVRGKSPKMLKLNHPPIEISFQCFKLWVNV